jgi:chromate transport protein ChrA
MAKQNYYQPGNFDAGQYNKNLKNLLKKLLAIILAIVLLYVYLFWDAACRLEKRLSRPAATGMIADEKLDNPGWR